MLSTANFNAILKKYLSTKRLEHSHRVANLAKYIAKKNSLDWHLAYTAGLLHDIARDMDKKELIYLAKKYQLYHYPMDIDIPILLHSYVGAWLTENKLGITDETILEAIRFHTLGSPKMGSISMVVYISDILEPERNIDGSNELIELALSNLDKAMLYCLNSTLKYLMDTEEIIHPLTVETRNHYLNR
ncbi:MAG: hypothetical protein APF76_12880 [Desulfitibacter sp. BRH_c19]|nr:MAG: hypothetical protein APF76_12880 [Desulfitibacter sp. BRH_c19]